MTAAPLPDGFVEQSCPATFGREAAHHSWIKVSKSSYRDAPYTMCSKCGAIAYRKEPENGQA